MYDPRYPSTPPNGPPPSTPSVPIVMVLDAVLGKELQVPLVDGNYAVTTFPSRFSYAIQNPYGNDNPLPPTGLPPASALPIFGPTAMVDPDTNIEQAVEIFPWELTIVFDSDPLVNTNRIMFQIDAIFAIHTYPARFSYVGGASTFPNPQPTPPVGPEMPSDYIPIIDV